MLSTSYKQLYDSMLNNKTNRADQHLNLSILNIIQKSEQNYMFAISCNILLLIKDFIDIKFEDLNYSVFIC